MSRAPLCQARQPDGQDVTVGLAVAPGRTSHHVSRVQGHQLLKANRHNIRRVLRSAVTGRAAAARSRGPQPRVQLDCAMGLLARRIEGRSLARTRWWMWC